MPKRKLQNFSEHTSGVLWLSTHIHGPPPLVEKGYNNKGGFLYANIWPKESIRRFFSRGGLHGYGLMVSNLDETLRRIPNDFCCFQRDLIRLRWLQAVLLLDCISPALARGGDQY